MASEPPTPKASGMWAAWRDHANLLDSRLSAWGAAHSRDGGTQAREAYGIAARARCLAKEFQDWPFHPPTDNRRVQAIQDLIDLQRDGERLMAGVDG